jgi:hypothetical protein
MQKSTFGKTTSQKATLQQRLFFARALISGGFQHFYIEADAFSKGQLM